MFAPRKAAPVQVPQRAQAPRPVGPPKPPMKQRLVRNQRPPARVKGKKAPRTSPLMVAILNKSPQP